MKKINSIWYGGKVILLGSILVVMPLGIIPFDFKILNIISQISLTIGCIILIGFGILLTIELHQDKKMNLYHTSRLMNKLVISENKYECQVCGNRNIKKSDSHCIICGTHFTE